MSGAGGHRERGSPRRSAAIHVCASPHLPCATSTTSTSHLPSVAEDVTTSTHRSANKSTDMADRSSPQPVPKLARRTARVRKNPSVVGAVLQRIARVVSHISSRSKQCVTSSAGEERSAGAVGCEERGGGSRGAHIACTQPRYASGPIRSLELKLTSQSAGPRPTHSALSKHKTFS